MEKYGLYLYKIILAAPATWVYEIYDPNYPNIPPLRESSEWFETEQRARYAAIGHIDLLENGEG